MARAHPVAAQLVSQDIRVQALGSFRRRVAHVGPALVPVQPPDLHPAAVEIAAVRLHPDRPEPEADLPLIQHFAVPEKLQPERVQVGVFCVPQLRPGHMHMKMILELLLLHAGNSFPAAIQDAGPDLAVLRACGLHLHLQMLPVIGHDKDVREVGFLPHLQVDRAVEPSVGHVVDDVAERRDIQALPAVQPHHDPIPVAVPKMF